MNKMRFDTNLNPDETKRPSSRTAAQAIITMAQCSQTRTTQAAVGQGQTVNP